MGRFRRRLSDSQSRRIQTAQGLVECGQITHLGVIGKERQNVIAVGQDVFHEAVQRLFRSHLHEDPGTGRVQGLQPFYELDRAGDLPGKDIDHLGFDAGSHRVEVAGDVGDNGEVRGFQSQGLEHPPERFTRRCDDAGVERVADGDEAGGEAGRFHDGHRLLDGLGSSPDHRLAPAVDVGDDHVAVHFLEQRFNGVEGPEDRGHQAVVGDGNLGHLRAAGTDRLEGVGEGQGAGRHQGAVFTQAVSHDHVGGDPVGGHQPGEGQVGGQHRRLGDGGLAEIVLGLFDTGGILAVDEDEVAQRPSAEERGHHRVGLVEGRLDNRFAALEFPGHVDVLRSLSGVEEGHLRRRTASEKDALGAQHLPHGRIVGFKGLDGFGRLFRQLVAIAVVDGDAQRGPQVLFGRGAGSRRASRFGIAQQGGEPFTQGRNAVRADHGRAAQRTLGGHGTATAIARGNRGGLNRGAFLRLDAAGDVLFQDRMEVGAAETEGAHPGAAHVRTTAVEVPRAGLGRHVEGGTGEVDPGVGFVEVEAGGNGLVVEGQGGFEDAGGAGGALEVTDVGFDRSQRHGLRLQARRTEDVHQALGLDQVAHGGGGAVPFDEPDGVQRYARVFPGPLDGQLLSDRVGGGDALALAVGGAAQGADDRVDGVAVALGVLQPLEQEDRRPLAHDEAVGAFGVGPGAGGRQRPDFAELHVGGGAHVGIDTAGQHGVVVVFLQPFDGRGDGGHGRGASRVGDVVGTVEVEQRRQPSRDDVGEFPGHGVFGDLRKALPHVAAEFGQDGLPIAVGELGKSFTAFQFPGVFGKEDARGGVEVQVAAHGVAEDDGGAVAVQGAVGITELGQRLPGRDDRPLLGEIHGIADFGRYRQSPLKRVPVKVAHPSPDLGVALVGGAAVGVEIALRIPALRGRLGDGIDAVDEVFPDAGRIGGAGKNRAHTDDGDRFVR